MKLFVSYRRKDWPFTQSLVEKLRQQLAAEVFVDVDSIHEDDFVHNLMSELATCEAVLLVVSPNTFAPDRINRPDDWVRREVGRALELGKPLIMAGIDGLTPPTADVLPEEIRAITNKQCIAFLPDYFDAGVVKLANFIEKATPIKRRSTVYLQRAIRAGAGLVVLVALTVGLAFGWSILAPKTMPTTTLIQSLGVSSTLNTQAPESNVDLSGDIGEIRDQGPEGTAIGFAVAYTLQAAIKENLHQTVILSPRGIYFLAGGDSSGQKGASVTDALNVVQTKGAYLEADWPYSNKTGPLSGRNPSYRIKGYSQLTGKEQILKALREKKVVLTTIQVNADYFRPDLSGEITIASPLKPIQGQTAICVVGYNGQTDVFKFATSWRDWGAEGFGFIQTADLEKLMTSAYIVEV